MPATPACVACGSRELSVVEAIASADLVESYPIRWEFLRTVEMLGSEPRDVLELGCGTGEFLALATAAGHRVVGIDFSDAAVETARRRGLPAICGGFDALHQHVGAERRSIFLSASRS